MRSSRDIPALLSGHPFPISPPGDQAELLVVVREPVEGNEFSTTDDESDTRPSGPTSLEIVLTTDSPNALVLHWGTLQPKTGRTWHRPPPTLHPDGTVVVGGAPSVETEFSGFAADSAFAPEELKEARVPLQRIVIPVGLDVVSRGGV